MLSQTQSIYVSVAHRYWNFQWSEARNREVYGDQASREGVGSNLRLEPRLQLDGTAEVSLGPALEQLKKLVDHQCFFTDVPEFVSAPSTLESITLYLAEKLFSLPLPSGAKAWESLTVAENETLSCTVFPREKQVEMRVRILNLQLNVRRSVDAESGLGLARAEIWNSVRAVAPEFAKAGTGSEAAWAETLWRALQIKVKGLSELRIDLGGQRFLRVQS